VSGCGLRDLNPEIGPLWPSAKGEDVMRIPVVVQAGLLGVIYELESGRRAHLWL
jgi:hypothetical protein